jgi:hypothetical protein
MKVISSNFILIFVFLILSCSQKTKDQTPEAGGEEVTLQEQPSENKIDVLIDGKLFTSYRWPENVFKPVLYPIVSAGGSTITRGYPLEPREGERNDHRHQVGNWLNYGNVNGYDFWGNGHTGERLPNGGEIKHIAVNDKSDGKGQASMTTLASWVDPSGKELMSEKTEFNFISRGPVRIIDRSTTLTATGGQTVTFKDTKEGMFGLRVARQLELPSKEEVTLTDASGHPTTVKKMSNEGVTGNYRSSEGVTGEQVWSTRAKWMDLHGSIGNENISVVICDHPDNLSYPTWWHARGYGLFSANPLGAKDFTQGKEELNFSLPAGDSVTFRYRIIVASKELTDTEINDLSSEFAKKF